MNRACLVLPLCLALSACDRDPKQAPTAPSERSQLVEAKAVVAEPVKTTLPPTTPAPPKAPRALCTGAEPARGRAVPSKPVSASVAGGEQPLPEKLPTGGGYTWVNFWAAWCAPCKEEIPRLFGFQNELRKTSPGFRLAFVSLDDDERQLSAFLANQPPAGLRRTYWLKEGPEREEWLKAAGVDADPELPFHLLFDPKGKLRCVVKGAVEDRDLAGIRAVLAE